jgi:hypothetical protein
MGLLMVGAALLALVSPWVYRRILREDTGLTTPKKAIPLEESSLSLGRLEKTYKRLSTACLVMLIWYCANCLVAVTLQIAGVWGIGGGLSGQRMFQWDIGLLLEAYGIWISFFIVGLVFYLTFRQFHRRLIETAKDEATFHAFASVWDRSKTPFWEKVFVEWWVYLGCFVAAGLIVASKPSLDYDWIPLYPIPLSLKLMLILAGSVAIAAINAGFPRLRWLTILGGCFLLGYGINGIYRSFWEFDKNVSFLNSPGDWSVLFGIMTLNAFVVLAVFATLLLGGFHYFAKWHGQPVRVSLPKKIAITYCILGTLLLCTAPWCYTSLRAPYWYRRYCFTNDDAKALELCNEVMRLEKNECSDRYQSALSFRARTYVNMEQYGLALADYNALDYDIAIRHNGVGVYSRRGNVKFLLGDLHGAIADYTAANPTNDRSRDCNVLYHRGFAYEQLGETERAIADYTAAIEIVEKYAPAWQKYFRVVVPREGYDSDRISLDELKAIRDGLREGI